MEEKPFFEFTSQPVDESEEEVYTIEQSQPVDYTEMMKYSVFQGDYPFETIIEGIKFQFSNYIGSEDQTNYVNAFYTQYHLSMKLIEDDDSEDHPVEKKQILNDMLDSFENTICKLFETKLAITVMDKDDMLDNNTDIEQTLQVAYEFFILNAKNNFKRVISRDINAKIKTVMEDDNTFYDTIRSMLEYYSPIITVIGPDEFLRYCEDQNIIDQFENNKLTGNFLKKYSPRLYQFEEFEVDIINQIVLMQEFQEDQIDG